MRVKIDCPQHTNLTQSDYDLLQGSVRDIRSDYLWIVHQGPMGVSAHNTAWFYDGIWLHAPTVTKLSEWMRLYMDSPRNPIFSVLRQKIGY